MSRIEGHYFCVAVGAQRNAILERIRTVIGFGNNVVALKPRVLSLVAETAMPLAGNKSSKADFDREWHLA
jgi:hypothetical protein